MLALDSVVVIDEAHLNRQLLCTARRVGELVERTANELGVPALQVVSMTATPTEVADANTVGVTAHGLESDSQLAARLTVPKLVTSVTSSNWRPKAKASAAHVELLCAEVERLRASYEGTIGCVVNRVDTAVRVAAKLRKAGLDAALWVGRLRPIDAQQLRNHNPELFDSRLSPTMDVLVATQTVEVGVDLDLPAMVTELAPATSLVQRAGRINRRGSRDSGSLVVVRPEQTVIGEDAPPYKGGDLQRASDWLDRLIAESGGISADALLAWPPPLETPHRMQFMRPELHDTRRWASTSTQWLVDEDLELWLRDDLQPNSPEAGLVVRGQLPEDPLEALELLRVTLPSDDEAFPVKIGLLRDTITNILEGRNAGPARAFLWRGGGMEQLEAATLLRPGDVAIIDCGHAVTTERVVVGPADAVLEELEVGWGSPGRVVVFPESDEFGLLELLAGLSGAEAQDRFAEITDSTDLLAVPAGIDPSCSLPWLVRTPAQQILDDEGYRQTLSLRNEAWPLDEHQDLVAARAEELGRMCGLPEALVLAEYTAGAHHDDGKSRPEFQRERLGNRSSGVPVAKSAWKNTQPAWRGPSSLPVGWRHEHLSVAMADLAIDLTHPHRDLCLRLIGTSHGHGRGVPPHGTQDLTVANDAPDLKAATQRLFDEGGWNELLELTDLQFGVWGCAFLEALLRAADCQVSKEGQ